ncbi:MAG: hypothetical protein M4579_005835 [Chaenotheca gracillima]|nr:MAG: hypothetical protein M4579_005835 [Chaenotheca gracillima]
MANVLGRAAKLKALFDLRLGPGAAVLPPEIKRIHLDFAYKWNSGHLGPRKFWHKCLPRLKYHNPAVSMTVNRTTDQKAPATMSIFFSSPSRSDSPTAAPTPTSSTSSPALSDAPTTPTSDSPPVERVESIDMKDKTDSAILASLMELTKAFPVNATPEELDELARLQERAIRTQADSARTAKWNAEKRKEKAVLAQARGEVASAEAPQPA